MAVGAPLAGRVTPSQKAWGLILFGGGLGLASLLFAALKIMPAPLSGQLAPGGLAGSATMLGVAMVPAVIGAAIFGAGVAELRHIKNVEMDHEELRGRVTNCRTQLRELSSSYFANSHAAFELLKQHYGLVGADPHQIALQELRNEQSKIQGNDRKLLLAVTQGLTAEWVASATGDTVPKQPGQGLPMALASLVAGMAALAAITALLVAPGTDMALGQLSEKSAIGLYAGLAALGISSAAIFGASIRELGSGKLQDPSEMNRDELTAELDFLNDQVAHLSNNMFWTTWGAEHQLKDLPHYDDVADRLEAVNTLLSQAGVSDATRSQAEQVQLGLAMQIGTEVYGLYRQLQSDGVIEGEPPLDRPHEIRAQLQWTGGLRFQQVQQAAQDMNPSATRLLHLLDRLNETTERTRRVLGLPAMYDVDLYE
jgi:hypothetical protein